MNVELLQAVLGWCAVINYGILLWWFLWISVAPDWIYGLHTRWFRIDRERFDAIHYAAMAGFKLAIFVLNIAPYLALRIVRA